MRLTKKKVSLCALSCAFVLTAGGAAAFMNFGTEKAYAAQPFTTTDTIAVQKGASIYIGDENASGIRFQTNVNKTWYDGLTGDKVAGSIVVPVEYVNAVEGDFTLQKLVDVVEEKGAPFKAVETAELAEKEGHYSYALSMTEVLEANYARQFVAISYVKNTAGTVTVEGITEENAAAWGLDDGNYYVAYDAENVRSIYNVSYNILSTDDAKANEKEAAKTYADKVLDLDSTSGELVIANNIDGKYTSPYTLNATGATVYNGKNVVLNGARATETDFPIKVGAKSVHITKTQNATFEGEEVTLQGAIPTSMVSGGTLGSIGETEGNLPNNLGYYALNGCYGLGTYLDISFTGKNIPSVVFFANKINGNLGTGEGVVVLNGGESATTERPDDQGVHFSNIVKVTGPNRVPNATSISDSGYLRVSDTFKFSTGSSYTGKAVTGLGKFAYANLEDNGNYRYIVGTFEQDGNVWMEVGLYNSGVKIEHITFDTNLTTSQVTAGYITMFATLKKDADNNPVDTTFTLNGILDAYPEIAGMKMGGGSINADGSFTLSDAEIGNGNPGSVRTFENGYVGWEGEYGVDTYVEFEFTGNNMPQLCFFADEVNGWVTCGDTSAMSPASGKNQGFMILNGVVANTSTNTFDNGLRVYGPERYYFGGTTSTSKLIMNAAADDTVEIKKQVANALSQSALAANGNVTYRMVIGTSVAQGKLFLNIYLFNATTNVKILNANLMTEYAVADASTLKGGIIAMAGLKNGTDTTTFKVTKAPATIDQFDIVGTAES